MQLIELILILRRSAYLPIVFLILISSQIQTEEKDCDILCRAGIEAGPLELEDKEEAKEKKSYKTSSSLELLITDTRTTQALLNNSLDYLNELLEIDITNGFSAEIRTSRGDRHNFSIKEMKIFWKDPYEKHTLLEIDRIACSDGQYSGVGINDAQPYYDFYDFKVPDIEYYMNSGECNFSGIDINLPIIFGLSGTDYSPSSFPIPLFGMIEEGSSDIDMSFSSKVNGNKITYGFASNLANQLSFSLIDTLGFEKKELHELLERLRAVILIKTRFTEEEIINRRQEFFEVLAEGLFNDGYLLEELVDEMDYFSDRYPIKLYGISTEIAWSDDLFSQVSRLSSGVVDAAMLALKAYTYTRMNKYEFLRLMESLAVGIDYSLLALYGDIFYNLYSETFDEIKKFTNNPKGLGFSINSPNGIDNRTLMGIEENPTLIFTVLNNTKFKIYANPRIN